MIAHLPPEHPASETVQLQETLGHTPLQVVMGAALGLLVGSLVIGLYSLAGS
jgi:acid phosphatase family membrane protein YuiD